MAHSLLQSLILYLTLTLSVALAAPTHQHLGEGSKALAQDGLSRRAPAASVPAAIGPGEEKLPHGVRKRVTNAVRIANGLPPLAPRKLYTGSQTGSANRPRNSQMPVYGAAIFVYGPDGLSSNQLGYVSANYNAYGDYFVAPSCTQAMRDPKLFSGALTNPDEPKGYSNVGFDSWGGTTFSTDSMEYAWMGGTEATPSGFIGIHTTHHSNINARGYIESNIWSLGPDNELIPTWVNPDGETVQTKIGYVTNSENSIIITGNPKVFETGLIDSGDTVPVRLFLAEYSPCMR